MSAQPARVSQRTPFAHATEAPAKGEEMLLSPELLRSESPCTRRTACCALALSAAAAGLALAGCSREIDSAAKSGIRVALLAGTGGVNDGTLSEADYKALTAYCSAHDLPFRYYQHVKENLVESEVVIDAAIADGYNVLVSSDYTYGTAVGAAQITYPEVTFIALDCTEKDFGVALESNLVAFSYEEAISAYLAGYAAVAMGYKHLGYLGGMALPAVIRYEAGYLWGADQAARDLGIAGITVETVMGNQFFGDGDITAYMDTWYQNLGVEVVFSCGGGIYTSNAEAASKANGKTIGVDSDQKKSFDVYKEGMCITSALKNTAATINMILDEIRAGNFAAYGGKAIVQGLASADNPSLNYVGLPLESTQWTSSFTEDAYRQLVGKVFNGEITVSSTLPTADQLVIAFNDHGSIK